MSQGSFLLTRYAADYGDGTNIHPIKVQPETAELSVVVGGSPIVNTPPAGALTNPISAKVSNSRRSLGLTPAKITFKFAEPIPTGFASNVTITVPILDKAMRNAIKNATGTYLTFPIVVVSVSPEQVQ
jgi:hypothetical protein